MTDPTGSAGIRRYDLSENKELYALHMFYDTEAARADW
jgi:hypothetical protein